MITGSNRMSSRRGELQFLRRELVEETAALKNMAAKLLAPSGDQVLAGLGSQIDAIPERSAGGSHEIRLRPLHTRPTRDYEPGSKSGGSAIYAKITGIWEVRSVGGKRPKTKVSFTGKASTVVELWPAECPWGEETEETSRLAKWQIELGAYDSPGCYFHVHLGDRDAPPFPKSIPIPRLPSPFVTPMSAVEYVLGELFQDIWERRAAENRHHQQRWRTIQHQRWLSLLEWQKKALTEGGSSPWMNLKGAKPPADMFLKN